MGAQVVVAAWVGAGRRWGRRSGSVRRYARILWAMVIALAALASLMPPPDSTATVAAAGSFPVGSLDSPAEGATIVGSGDVGGWAADVGAAVGVGVDRVQVYLDGALRGTATYGQARTDIAAGYGAQFGASGYHYMLDLTGVPAGPHTIETRARSTIT